MIQRALKKPEEDFAESIKKQILWIDSGFCAIYINNDPMRNCRLTLTYTKSQNLVIQNGHGNCKTLYLPKNGGRAAVLMRKVHQDKEDFVGPYTYLVNWEDSTIS